MQQNSSTNIVEFLLSEDLAFNQYLGISDIKSSFGNADGLNESNTRVVSSSKWNSKVAVYLLAKY